MARFSYTRALRPVLALLLLASGPGAVSAQDAPADRPFREGFWIGFGVGPGNGYIDCARCGAPVSDDPWEGGSGMALYLALGRAVRPDLLLGAEMSGWLDEALEREASLVFVAFIAQYYPLEAAGLYLKGGVGFGGAELTDTDALINSGNEGPGMQAGLGYDIRIKDRFALSPFATYVQFFYDGAPGTNKGVSVKGPDNPSYLQFGLGFTWY